MHLSSVKRCHEWTVRTLRVEGGRINIVGPLKSRTILFTTCSFRCQLALLIIFATSIWKNLRKHQQPVFISGIYENKRSSSSVINANKMPFFEANIEFRWGNWTFFKIIMGIIFSLNNMFYIYSFIQKMYKWKTGSHNYLINLLTVRV